MSYSETLRKIQGVAKSLASLLDDSPHVPRGCSTLPLEEHFPLPQPLTSRLSTIGLDPVLADRLSQTYESSAMELKSKYECKYAAAHSKLVSVSDHCGVSCTKVQTQFLNALIARYQGTLSLWAREAIKKAELRHAKDISLQNIPLVNEKNTTRDNYSVVKMQISTSSPTQILNPIVKGQKFSEAKGLTDSPCSSLSEKSLETARPSYAFPSVYPPPNRDIKPLLHHLTRLQPLALSVSVKECPLECDIECCITALARCSLSSGSEACISSSPTLPHVDVHKNTPRMASLDAVQPSSPTTPAFKFSSKITPSDCRPASPMLYKPLTFTFKPEHTSDSIVTLTSNLTSYTLQPDRKTRTRKITPLPRRTPGGKVIPHAPSDECIGSPVSSTGRTPSLMSDRSCESNLSSPYIGPTTPPPSHSELSPIFLESGLAPSDLPSSLERSAAKDDLPNSTWISVSTEYPLWHIASR